MGSAASSLPMVDRSIVLRGPLLSHHDQELLCSSFSAKEITDALFSMDSCNRYGYNVDFFKKVWVGSSVSSSLVRCLNS